MMVLTSISSKNRFSMLNVAGGASRQVAEIAAIRHCESSISPLAVSPSGRWACRRARRSRPRASHIQVQSAAVDPRLRIAAATAEHSRIRSQVKRVCVCVWLLMVVDARSRSFSRKPARIQTGNFTSLVSGQILILLVFAYLG
jgi:Mg-chelatase subunit ChlD